MSNVFTYLRDPGLAIHCHQVAFSALPPLYKTQLVTLTVMLHGFPNNLLAKWEVWILKDRYNSELNARFVLTNRIACRNTLWGLAWVNQFTEDRDPALLSELWEKCAIWIGPSMLCLSKVPVCMCVCDLILCHIYLYPYNCLLTDVRSPSVLPGQVLTRAAVHVNEMCVLSE